MDIPEKSKELTAGQLNAIQNTIRGLFDLLCIIEPETADGIDPVEVDQDYLEENKALILEEFERLSVSIGYIFSGGNDD